MPFQKDNTLGRGRPKGSRNKSTVWLDELALEGTEALVRKVTETALAGTPWAAALVLARTWPRRYGRPVVLDLPGVESAGGVVQAQATVVAAMAAGELTPDEAAAVASVLENKRRAIETWDHEQRLQAIENRP